MNNALRILHLVTGPRWGASVVPNKGLAYGRRIGIKLFHDGSTTVSRSACT